MSTPGANFIEGSFVATGSAVSLDLLFKPDYFELQNYTQAGSSASTGVVKRAWYFAGMPAGSALVVKNTNSAATDATSALTTGGFTLYDGGVPSLGNSQALTSTYITQANPALVTSTTHGLVSGDIIRLYNPVGMLQLGGIEYVVTVVDANTFTIPVDSSGFAAAATAGSFRKVIVPGLWYVPQRRIVASISKATSAVVTTCAPHGFLALQKVRLMVPAAFGMTQMNQLLGTISAVGSSVSFTVSIDSSAFSTFAWPASASQPFTPAEVVPVGEDVSILTGATHNSSFKGVTLGASVCGAASDVVYWIAKRADAVQ